MLCFVSNLILISICDFQKPALFLGLYCGIFNVSLPAGYGV